MGEEMGSGDWRSMILQNSALGSKKQNAALSLRQSARLDICPTIDLNEAQRLSFSRNGPQH
jgi:hypothetical protein